APGRADGGALVLLEQGHRLAEPRRDALGVLQPVALGAQLVLLAIGRLHRVDLGQLEAVQILLPRGLSELRVEPLAPAARVLPRAHEGGDALAPRPALCEAVEQIELAGRLEQPLVLVLTVQLHEQVAQALEQADRRRLVVDEDAVAPRPRDLSLHDELPARSPVPPLL